MIKIILGIIVILGSINNLVRFNFSTMGSPGTIGYFGASVLFFILGGWLIYSGFKKRSLVEKKEKKIKISPKRFLKDLFFDYKNYLNSNIKKKVPYFFGLIWVLGVAAMIPRVNDSTVLKGGVFNDWIKVWMVLIVLGVAVGLVAYMVMGTIYHFRIWVSGGKGEMRTSRKLYLYSSLPFLLSVFIAELINTVVYGNGYFINPTNGLLDFILLIFIFAALTWSVIRSYKSVVLIQKTKKIRTIIIFLILPALIYAVVFLGGATEIRNRNYWGLKENRAAEELMLKGDLNGAKELLNSVASKVNTIDPEALRLRTLSLKMGVKIYGNLGKIYEAQQDVELAAENYKKAAMSTNKKNEGYHYYWGKAMFLEGDFRKAAFAFEEVLKINPEHHEAHEILGYLYLGTKEVQLSNSIKALPHSKKAYKEGKTPKIIESLGMNYFILGEYESAKLLFEELDGMISNPNAKYFLGLIYNEEGDIERAKRYIEEALELNPELEGEEAKEILKR